MRRLVVTGDDFGASDGVNAAIAEAHRSGVLTSASLMVTGQRWRQAVDIARELPSLSVGLHLVLVDGKSALGRASLPHLVDRRGRFSPSPLAAGLRYQFHPAARRELAAEIRAQLERFRATGLPLAHVDGHHHLHVHPSVISILADSAAEFGIPAIRLPSEELGTALSLDPRRRAMKVLWSAIFARLRSHAGRRLARAGVLSSDRVYGLLATGRITEEYVLALIPRLQGDRVELYAHPSRNDPAGVEELAALLSPAVRESLSRHRVALVDSRTMFASGVPTPADRGGAVIGSAS